MPISIKAEKREKIGKLESLRKEGLIPAVFYGRKEKSVPIQIKKAEFVKTWKEAGESSVVTLQMTDKSVDALIQEVALDPVTEQPVHVDFYVFEKGQKIEVEVPIEFEGVSPAVKELGGVLVKVLRELKIKADPSSIPSEIIVNISTLVQFGDNIVAGDIKLPKEIELVENPGEVVVNVAEPKEEKEDVAPIDLTQIEVEKKGKEEEEGTEAPAPEPQSK